MPLSSRFFPSLNIVQRTKIDKNSVKYIYVGLNCTITTDTNREGNFSILFICVPYNIVEYHFFFCHTAVTLDKNNNNNNKLV